MQITTTQIRCAIDDLRPEASSEFVVSPDGQYVLYRSTKGCLRIYNDHSGRTLDVTGVTENATPIGFSADSREFLFVSSVNNKQLGIGSVWNERDFLLQH